MSLLWPQHLWWMLALPLLLVAYLWLLRRRVRVPLRLSSIAIAQQAQVRAWRRHVPPALFFVALALLLLAFCRPVGTVTLPGTTSTILLAMDVSLSMRVTDVSPSRMVAAQEAAKGFLQDLPRDVDVGLITFAGTAQVAQRATRDRPSLVSAIDGIQMQRGTAIGSAIVVCLAELFPDHGIDLGEMTFGATRSAPGAATPATPARSLDARGKAPARAFTPVSPGSYESATIILLSDGRRTEQPYPDVSRTLLPAHAFENDCFIAYANRCGQERVAGEVMAAYLGNSVIVGPHGDLLVAATAEPTLLLADCLPGEYGPTHPAGTRYLEDRRPELY